MIYYGRIEDSQVIYVNKTGASKGSNIFPYCYILDK